MRASILVLGCLVLSACQFEVGEEEDASVSSLAASSALLDVAKSLNGQMLTAPCGPNTGASVCRTSVGACPVANPTDRALSGVLLTDKTVTLGGDPAKLYTVTLQIQGVVEAKQYIGSVDSNSAAPSPNANGFAVGGVPTAANAFSVYLLRVTNPGSAAKTDYFLNSIAPPGVSDHTTYGVNYTASIKAKGGAKIRLVAADSNCSMIKNCGPIPSAAACLAPITLTNVNPVAVAANPSFNFSSPYNGQWLSLVVTNVTTP